MSNVSILILLSGKVSGRSVQEKESSVILSYKRPPF